MSYLRPLSLHPSSLRQCATDAWLQHLRNLVRESDIIAAARGKRTFSVPTTPVDNEDEEFKWHGISMMPKALMDYLDNFLPLPVQEECYHRGTQMLRKEVVFFDFFPILFRLQWRPHFRHLDLPPISHLADRIIVLEYLAKESVNKTDTAKFRLFDNPDISIEESYLMKRILRSLTNVRSLVLWWAADDQMLNIIGSTCHHLESIDLWRSCHVTDLGLKMLLLSNDDDLELDLRGDSPLCRTLKHLGVKETSVTHIGCIAAIMRCPRLEVLNFSHNSVVKEFFTEIRNLHTEESRNLDGDIDSGGSSRNKRSRSCPPGSFSLKSLFFPVVDGSYFKDVVQAFPSLEDLKIWTTVNHIRDVTSKDLPKLHSLLLGGLHSNRVLGDLTEAIGKQLTTLKLETILAEIELEKIGQHCPNLVELQVINGRLVVRNHKCSEVEAPSFFSKLRLIYLFLVQYVIGPHDNPDDERNRPVCPLHCLLTHATSVEGIQVTGCSLYDDEALKKTLEINPMKNLKRFIMTDATVQDQQMTEGTSLNLTSRSVHLLFDHCPGLTCIGDLRQWNISPSERRQIAKKMQEKTGTKWISTASH